MNPRSIAFLFVTFLSFTTITAGQTPSLLARKDFSTSAERNSVALADVNGDGIPDMVAAGVSGDVSVLLGNGDGTFQPAQDFPTGISAVYVTAADFNGDGNLDLAVAGGNAVSILLGNGDGTFQAPMQFAVGANCSFIAVGDFNGDSIPDMAVTSQGDPLSDENPRVSVFLGNGDGSFSAGGRWTVGNGPRSVAIGDFNGDGNLDLAVGNWGRTNGPNGSYVPDTTISLLFGRGDGTFTQPQNLEVGTGPRYVVVGDFNADGNQDLAVLLQESSEPNRGSIHVLFGDGAGGFADGGTYVVGSSPQGLAAGDLNNDGATDLLAGNLSGTLSVLFGNGDGSFSPGPDIPAVFNVISVALADMNGDGNLDVALAGGGPGISLIAGRGDGSFQTAELLLTGPVVRNSIVTADFNQDGNVDVAVPGPDDTVSVSLGNGDGTFQPPQLFGVSGLPRLLASADLNGDGIPDLVLDIGSQLSVMLGNGDGTFQNPINLGAPTSSVAVGDVNGDGIPDLVSAGNSFNNSPILVRLGNGDGTFQNPMSLGITGDFVVVGDFNGDGNLDVALVSANSNPVSILLGNGDGTFQPPIQRSTPSGTFGTLAVGDFNGDGILDLAATFIADNSRDNVLVMMGVGDGTFNDPVGYAVGGLGFAVGVADVNGDGIADLVVDAGVSVGILIGNGDGSFQPAVLFGPGGPVMKVADFNNDGKPDVAISDAFLPTRGLAILLNNQP